MKLNLKLTVSFSFDKDELIHLSVAKENKGIINQGKID